MSTSVHSSRISSEPPTARVELNAQNLYATRGTGGWQYRCASGDRGRIGAMRRPTVMNSQIGMTESQPENAEKCRAGHHDRSAHHGKPDGRECDRVHDRIDADAVQHAGRNLQNGESRTRGEEWREELECTLGARPRYPGDRSSQSAIGDGEEPDHTGDRRREWPSQDRHHGDEDDPPPPSHGDRTRAPPRSRGRSRCSFRAAVLGSRW